MAKLPTVTSKIPSDLRQFLDRVREAFGVGMQRVVTAQELVDLGVAATGPGGTLSPTPGAQEDCQNPPAPTNLSADGALASVLLTWDQPIYRCHAYAEIFAGETDVVGNAVLIGQAPGTVFTHAIGGAASRYYWVRFVSTQGVIGPFNATNGTLGETGQDPAYLLGLLNGQITESQLYADLNTRIDLIDGPSTTPGTLAYEAAQRALDDATEAQARIDGIQAEASARIADVNANATTALNALTAINTTRNELLAGVTQATFELTQYVDAGVSAEANARLALKAQLEADDDVLTAAVLSEQNARVEGDAAEASARQGLTAQILGADGTAQTSGLLWQESQARASQDAALSQQITLLSAGAGETFDFKTIWYFDSGVENWTSNGGTPTATLGWLRPFNHATDPYVTSPTISEDGSKYTQVRVRVRKTGTLTWGGNLWWYNGTWSSIAIDEPSFDAVGISVVTVNPAWSGTITQIRLDLSTAQDASNYFEIDWVAIGRPAPGASTASVFELSHATVDMANSTSLAYKMTALTAKVDDPVSGNTALASAVSNTYTKAQADSALAGREAAIAARYGTTANKIFRQDAAPVQGTTNLTTQTGTVAVSNIANGDLWIDTNDGNKQYVWETGSWVERQNTSLFGTAAFTSATEDYLANGEGAFVTQIQDTVATVNDPETGNAAAIATANEALEATATLEETLVRESKQIYAAQDGFADIDLKNLVLNSASAKTIKGAMATVLQDSWANTTQGLAAEAGMRTQLAAVVDANYAEFEQEIITRSTADSALSQSIASLSATVDANNVTLAAAIGAEQSARVSADGALSQSIAFLSATVDANNVTLAAAIGAEQSARVSADGALAQDITTLQTTVDGHTTSIQTNASSIDGVKAQYTVKIDNNGYVTGFGLASTATNATPFSEFAVVADKFSIAPVATDPNASGSPFYHLTVPTVVNGVTVPAGTYMNTAFIADATITSAKIGSLAADKITSGSIDADRLSVNVISAVNASIQEIDANRISTTNLSAKLAQITEAYIDTANITDAAITNAKIQDGEITNAKIGSVINSTNFNGSIVNGSISTLGTAGWAIDKAGQAVFNSGTFRGTLDVKSATSGARLEMKNNVIKVFDENGVLRVKIGDLSA